MKNKDELFIVTEVGNFGEMGIKDPTAKKVREEDIDDKDAKDEEEMSLEDIIRNAIHENKKNL